jgi:ferredoxin-type protein NapH
MSNRLVPRLRRLVQIASIAVLVLLPLLALYTHYKAARAVADLPAGWRSTAIRGIDSAVGESAARRRAVETTQGTFWSARLLGYSLSDPLAGAEAMASSRMLYGPLLGSLVVPVSLSVLLGRVFCGWICPMNTLLELVDRGRRWLGLLEIRERDVRFSKRTKYLVLAVALGLVAVSGVPFLAMAYPPAVISRELHLFVFGTGIGIGVYVVLAICLFELFVSRRWWCRYVCPGGGLYSLLGRIRLIRVQRNVDNCIRCGECVTTCQFDLRPMLVSETGMECTNCAACIRVCDSNALAFALVLPGRGRQREGDGDAPPPERRGGADKVRREPRSAAVKGVLTALLLISLLPAAVSAHHILGLPHYSYKENYPQAPTLEYPASTGPYDVLMTSYPGRPVPGEAATIAFYIKDRHTQRPYDQPVTIRVLQTATFGANTIIHPAATHRPFDNQHRFTITFPEQAEFVVELTLQVEGQPEVIPFLMVVGNPTATLSVVIAIACGLVCFLVVVRAIKIKQQRRSAADTATQPIDQPVSSGKHATPEPTLAQ